MENSKSRSPQKITG